MGPDKLNKKFIVLNGSMSIWCGNLGQNVWALTLHVDWKNCLEYDKMSAVSGCLKRGV